jgi:pimeloyl-ACP methyl ester carboxylesterase/DNA-binding CsgD family transcriptional regulator
MPERARWAADSVGPGVDALGVPPPVRFTRTADDVTIAYCATGDGPPLVLMPSLPLGNLTGEWSTPVHRDAFVALSRHVRLIQYDARGSGRSQRDAPDLSPDAMLRDLDAVRAAVDEPRVALVGMYLSCANAVAYALRHPERVSHLVLFGGSARGWDSMGARETQALLSLMEQDWDTFVESAFHAWMGWSAGEAGRLATESARTSTTAATARAMLQAASGLDLTDQLGSLEMPTLVFHRRGVRQVPIEVSEALAAAIPDGRLCVLDGSTASLFVEGFDEVRRELVGFVTGRPPSPARPGGPEPPADAASPGGLTPREVEVLRLVAQGEKNAAIAHRLGVSVHTVERHVANLYRKIDARGRADATAYAIRRGLA